MPPRSFGFVVLGILALILGLFSGIFRLMVDNGVGDAPLSQLYTSHSTLMVYGFIATLIMTERVAGLRVLTVKQRLKFTSTLMAPLTWLGAMVYTFGNAWGVEFGDPFGVALILIGVSAFVATLYMLAALSHMEVPFLYMTLSAFSLMLGALQLGFAQPEHNMGMIMLFLGFPIIFILGERVELMGFLTATNYKRRFIYTVYTLVLSVTLFATSSTITILHGANYATRTLSLLGVLPVAFTMVSYYHIERDTFSKLSASAQPIQRYVATHTRTAYIWGILGSILMASYLAGAPINRLYDASIHTFAIGFVGTMFLAHGPIIFPTVTGRRLDPLRLNKAPLTLLTLSTAIRVFGDLVVGETQSPLAMTAVWVSGWLILAVVLMFLATLIRASGLNGRVSVGMDAQNTQPRPGTIG
ncbi:MAG: hypothetical protein QW514_03300 [Thermoprotei archaeon]